MTLFIAIALAITLLACRILDGFERAPKVHPLPRALPKNTRKAPPIPGFDASEWERASRCDNASDGSEGHMGEP